MDRLLRGVIKYRQTVRADLVKQFESIRKQPELFTAAQALMFTCMDSRILPTRFTQARVGDIFVVRNAGNLIPDARNYGDSSEVCATTEPAALELAVKRGSIRHVIVCGHSDCKAMNLLYGLHSKPHTFDHASPMDHWVRKSGFKSIQRLNERLYKGALPLAFESELAPSQNFEAIIDPFDRLAAEDKLSQINVLQQMLNICTHDFLKERFANGELHVHAMWFDVYQGEDYLFSKEQRRFVVIQEETVGNLLGELNRRCGVPTEECRDIKTAKFALG